jgi:hypothetical protein
MLGKEWLKKIDLRKMVGDGKEGKRLVVDRIFGYLGLRLPLGMPLT